MLYLCRRSSSLGAQLFQERGKPLEHMSVLAETEEEDNEDGADEPGDTEKSKEPSALPQGEKDKPKQDVKDSDPLAALGNKLAKLR